jgi:hypothetical protein
MHLSVVNGPPTGPLWGNIAVTDDARGEYSGGEGISEVAGRGD